MHYKFAAIISPIFLLASLGTPAAAKTLEEFVGTPVPEDLQQLVPVLHASLGDDLPIVCQEPQADGSCKMIHVHRQNGEAWSVDSYITVLVEADKYLVYRLSDEILDVNGKACILRDLKTLDLQVLGIKTGTAFNDIDRAFPVGAAVAEQLEEGFAQIFAGYDGKYFCGAELAHSETDDGVQLAYSATVIDGNNEEIMRIARYDHAMVEAAGLHFLPMNKWQVEPEQEQPAPEDEGAPRIVVVTPTVTEPTQRPADNDATVSAQPEETFEMEEAARVASVKPEKAVPNQQAAESDTQDAPQEKMTREELRRVVAEQKQKEQLLSDEERAELEKEREEKQRQFEIDMTRIDMLAEPLPVDNPKDPAAFLGNWFVVNNAGAEVWEIEALDEETVLISLTIKSFDVYTSGQVRRMQIEGEMKGGRLVVGNPMVGTHVLEIHQATGAITSHSLKPMLKIVGEPRPGLFTRAGYGAYRQAVDEFGLNS